MRTFKQLFFNKNSKNRFILKTFRNAPVNISEFKEVLSEHKLLNISNEAWIAKIYIQYVAIFNQIKFKNPKYYSKYYWNSKCLNLDYPPSSDDFYLSRGWNMKEIEEIRREKYATGTVKFQMNNGYSKKEAIKLLDKRQQTIKEKRRKTYQEYLKEDSDYFSKTFGYSVKHFIDKGYSKEEAIIKSSEVGKKVSVKNKNWTEKQKKENPEYWNSRTETQLEYWIQKFDGDIEKAKKAYKDRQTTFSKNKCIEKYGKEKGIQIWKERNKKWSLKIEKMYRNGEFSKMPKSTSSKPELELMSEIVRRLDLKDNEYYSGLLKNQYTRYFKDIQQTFSYDFVYKNKIIEFNGDYFHMNPKIYESNDFNKMLGISAQEKWNYDKIRIESIEKEGYEVLVIWEKDYNDNKETIIEKCIKFLRDDK